MARWQVILGLLRPYAPYLGRALGLSILMTLLALPGPYVTKLLLDDAYPHRDYGLLHFLLLGGAAFALFLGGLQTVGGFFGRQLGLGMSLDLQSRLYRHVQSLDFGYFDSHETGEVLSRFDDLEASVSGVIAILNTVVVNALQLLVFPAVLIWIHPTLALLSLVVLPVDGVLAAVGGAWSRRYARRIAESAAVLSARTVESLAGIRTIQSLGAEWPFYRRVRERFEDLAVLQVRAAGVDGIIGSLALGARTAGVLAYSWYGWTQVLDGALTPGTFLAFSAYAGFIYGPLQQIIGLWPRIQTVRVHVDRFLEVYQRPPLVRAGPGALSAAGLRGEVRFENVVFGYGDRTVLCGASAELPAGRVTALVGASGAGKSTLVKLIPRFYDPQAGCVRIDGRDVRRYDLSDLRRQVGFALQGGCLFAGTIAENLTLGREIPHADVEDVCRAAVIHEEVAALAEGYETRLGEGGAGLSTGQQQRLALARVLLHDTAILILDEPTSALDPVTELAVRAALKRACDGRTVVLIAHRPETVAMAEEVLEVREGRVWSGGDRPETEACADLLAA